MLSQANRSTLHEACVGAAIPGAAARDYSGARQMTSAEYQQHTLVDELRKQFEDIVPTDWGSVDPIEIGQTMDN